MLFAFQSLPFAAVCFNLCSSFTASKSQDAFECTRISRSVGLSILTSTAFNRHQPSRLILNAPLRVYRVSGSTNVVELEHQLSSKVDLPNQKGLKKKNFAVGQNRMASFLGR